MKAETPIPVAEVGLITHARQADEILADGEADAMLLGREPLRGPSWARQTARGAGAGVRTTVRVSIRPGQSSSAVSSGERR